jgi:hypothetical protein
MDLPASKGTVQQRSGSSASGRLFLLVFLVLGIVVRVFMVGVVAWDSFVLVCIGSLAEFFVASFVVLLVMVDALGVDAALKADAFRIDVIASVFIFIAIVIVTLVLFIGAFIRF